MRDFSTLIIFINLLQKIISWLDNFLNSIEFNVPQRTIEKYKDMFYVMGNLLIAKAKHLFTVIKIATSYDPLNNKITIKDKTDDDNKPHEVFDYIITIFKNYSLKFYK